MISENLRDEILSEGFDNIFLECLKGVNKVVGDSTYYHNKYIKGSTNKELGKYFYFLNGFDEDEEEGMTLEELLNANDIHIKKYCLADNSRIPEEVGGYDYISLLDFYYDDEDRDIEFNNWVDLETVDMGWLWSSGGEKTVREKLLDAVNNKLNFGKEDLDNNYMYLIESKKYYGKDSIKVYHIIIISKDKSVRLDHSIVGTSYYVNML